MTKFISEEAFDMVQALVHLSEAYGGVSLNKALWQAREAKWQELDDYIQGLENKINEFDAVTRYMLELKCENEKLRIDLALERTGTLAAVRKLLTER